MTPKASFTICSTMFRAASLVIANLECPLIDKPTPISKTGPVFGEDSASINGIRAAGIDVLCLANNHILDHGAEGLENTLAVCAKAGVSTVGAGANLASARQVLVMNGGRRSRRRAGDGRARVFDRHGRPHREPILSI